MSDMFGGAGAGEPGLALARKWRPRSFDEVIGQDQAVRTLTAALASGRLHHAYMFTGTRGVGKTTLARIMAKSFNCDDAREGGLACNECSICEQIDSGTHPDVQEMDAASTTQVEHMRDMLEGLRFAPSSGRYRVCIIDEVHMLSRHSFNAMLKTLEEPPGHVKFILATTDPQQVPATVQSRCLRFALRRLTPQRIAQHLAHVLAHEGVEFDEAALGVIAAHADGSVRDALSILDEAIATGDRLTQDAMRDLVGLAGVEHVARLLELLLAGDVAGALGMSEQMHAQGVDLAAALGEMGELVHRSQLAAATGGGARDGADGVLAKLSPVEAQLVFEIASSAHGKIANAPDFKVAFDMTLLRIFALMEKKTQGPASGAPAPEVQAKPEGEVAAPQAKPAAPPSAGAAKTLRVQSAADWHGLATSSELSLKQRSLAEVCEFVEASDNRLLLRVARENEEMLAWKEGLRGKLRDVLGAQVRVEIELAETRSDATPGEKLKADSARREKEVIEGFKSTKEMRMIEDALGAADVAVRPSKGQEGQGQPS